MARTGYLFIDHRASPGMPDSKYLREGSVYEADTLWCSHCSMVMVRNPDRTRDRGHCPKCNEYLCDWCAAAYHENLICRPFKQVVDDLKSGKTPEPLLARHMKG
jgi:hypothetical protein